MVQQCTYYIGKKSGQRDFLGLGITLYTEKLIGNGVMKIVLHL
jgi:hypothetical protein